jgi:hypothetical protein
VMELNLNGGLLLGLLSGGGFRDVVQQYSLFCWAGFALALWRTSRHHQDTTAGKVAAGIRGLLSRGCHQVGARLASVKQKMPAGAVQRELRF